MGVLHNSNKCSLSYTTVVYSLLLLPPQQWDGITPMLASGRASSHYSTSPRPPVFGCLLHDQSLTTVKVFAAAAAAAAVAVAVSIIGGVVIATVTVAVVVIVIVTIAIRVSAAAASAAAFS